MANHIVLIHGRSFKPNERALRRTWLEALRFGIERDDPSGASLRAFDAARKTFVYYGDLSNEFLYARRKHYDEEEDVSDRAQCLAQLKALGPRSFDERRYNRIRGTNGLKEGFADLLSGPLSFLGVGDNVVGAVAPDMRHYWDPNLAWGSDVRSRLTRPLHRALKRSDDRVALISHSLGTIISYDVLWKFSHYSEYEGLRDLDAQLSLWLTLGSPLGDENVRDKLKGSTATGIRRYPTLVRDWVNVAAEDDYIAHDSNLADDYAEMKNFRLVRRLVDVPIFNLAVRDGTANPHHGAGYLIHPQVSRAVSRWLAG